MPRHVYWRRRLAAAAGLIAILAVVAVLAGSGGEPEVSGAPAVQEAVPQELPRGGRSVLPEHRVVAYYGAPQSRDLGALGIG
ncbi:MAG: hypothetical protein ACRDPC_09545, partial [Solirubrobacteraceae bacterium]